MKFGRYDSLDICLEVLGEKYAEKMSHYSEYYRSIGDFETFCKVHFVGEKQDKNKTLNLYKAKEDDAGEKLVIRAMQSIIFRANSISASKYSSKLWDCFNSNGLLTGT